MRERQASEREEVDLIFCGILIESENQLKSENPNDFTFRDLLELYLENYTKLCEQELKWTKRIDYSELEHPADFHEKFKYVREVEVNNRVNDEGRLVDSIKKFKRLNFLIIRVEAQL